MGVAEPVPLENRILCGELRIHWSSGGSHVLVDQAAQDRFSADLASVEIACRDAGRMVFSVGNALADSLMRPGGVVVRLVFGQDGAQVRPAEDQHAVQELMAQGADSRSQVAFMRGAWTAVRRIVVPAA